MTYAFHLLIYLDIYLVLAMSLNLVVGYCGLLTLAHAGYFAIGSYAYALATLKMGWGFVPATLLGVVVSAALSLAVSLPARRFKGDFFVLVSLAVQTLLFSLMYNWTSTDVELGSLANLTNGPFGIPGVPRPAILGIQLDTVSSICALSVVVAVVCGVVVWLLVSSPWGRLLKCMRDDELALRSLGKDTRRAKVEVFAIACGLAAAAGAVYASYVGYIDPSSASLDGSILMLCMVLVGGVGNFRGPLVGAAVLVMIPELLRFVGFSDSVAGNLRLLAYGLLLILMVRFRPQGLAGEYRVE